LPGSAETELGADQLEHSFVLLVALLKNSFPYPGQIDCPCLTALIVEKVPNVLRWDGAESE
jgi:hypothetical protein